MIGYSFPTDDAYGNRMIQEAVRRRCPHAMLTAHLHVLDDCLEVRSRLQEILPPDSLVECLGPLEN